MGKLIYGSGVREISFDDRTLAHLKLAIVNKLRRSEAFTLTWEHGVENGSGRSCLWMHPSIPLQFVFDGNRSPSINREWLEQLAQTANSIGGLQVVPEPPETGSHPVVTGSTAAVPAGVPVGAAAK